MLPRSLHCAARRAQLRRERKSRAAPVGMTNQEKATARNHPGGWRGYQPPLSCADWVVRASKLSPLPNHNETEVAPVGGRAGGPGWDQYCRGPSAPWPTFAGRELKKKSAIPVGMTEKTGGMA